MNLLDLFVRVGVKDEASQNVETLSDKLKGGLTAAAKVGAAAVGAASTAIVALTKSAVDNYGEYEQLVGGVKTLFGTEAESVEEYAASVGKSVDEVSSEYNNLVTAQNSIFAKASDAYKNAGLSANEYMETVTSFAASLVSSVGGDTVAAAEKADLAITDMSDNANKMGSSMESIQNAYQGFAKQNYTMLDNLKLGYGGTKEEMERLIDDANALNAAQGNYTNYTIDSYADIVDAIHTVQTEMGITGTTQDEAATTIQGSLTMMKAAYENFVTGLGDENADMAVLVNNLLESSITVAENLLPVIERVLENIGTILQEKGPELIERFVSYALEKLPDVIALGIQMIAALVKGLAQNLPSLISGVGSLINTILDTLADCFPDIRDIGKQIVKGLWEGISAMASWIKSKVSSFVGGIVSNVKGVLGIHSPSRVFAGIGENMALGLGEGWDSEYGSIKRGITDGLDFGTAQVGAEQSFGGQMRSALASLGSVSGDISIVVQSVLDGKIIGESVGKYNRQMQRAMGV